MRRILLADLAGQDLATALDYYEDRRPGLSRRFLERFKQGLKAIRPMPGKFRMIDGDYHCYALDQFPFGIVYRFDADTIWIVAIMSFRRSPEYWTSRMNEPPPV